MGVVTTNINGVLHLGTAQSPIGGPAVTNPKLVPAHVVGSSQTPIGAAHIRALSTGGGGGGGAGGVGYGA